MTPQASKTCKVWILLNPSLFSSGCLRIPDGVFPHFSLFEFSQGFLKDLFPLIHCYWMPFSLAKWVWVGRDSYGPPIQSPFDTLMVCGENEAMLMKLGAPQQNMVGNFWINHMESGHGYYWAYSQGHLHISFSWFCHPSKSCYLHRSPQDPFASHAYNLQGTLGDEVEWCLCAHQCSPDLDTIYGSH